MPAPDFSRPTSESRLRAAIYRRAQAGTDATLPELTVRAPKRFAEPDTDLARALRLAALDE